MRVRQRRRIEAAQADQADFGQRQPTNAFRAQLVGREHAALQALHLQHMGQHLRREPVQLVARADAQHGRAARQILGAFRALAV